MRTSPLLGANKVFLNSSSCKSINDFVKKLWHCSAKISEISLLLVKITLSFFLLSRTIPPFDMAFDLAYLTKIPWSSSILLIISSLVALFLLSYSFLITSSISMILFYSFTISLIFFQYLFRDIALSIKQLLHISRYFFS